jgi:hypothetical protein
MPRRRDTRAADNGRTGEHGDEGQRAGENSECSVHGVVALRKKGRVNVGMGKPDQMRDKVDRAHLRLYIA